MQTILHPNLIIVRLQDNSDKVYSKPLYASPIYHYNSKPTYMAQQLEVLKMDVEGKEQTDRMIHCLHDPLLTVEVHRYRMVLQELDQVEEALLNSEDQWGELAAMKLKTIQRLEMADALQRVSKMDDGLIDDALQLVAESLQRGCRA